MNAQNLWPKISVVNITDFTWRQNVPCNKLTKRIISRGWGEGEGRVKEREGNTCKASGKWGKNPVENQQ